MAQTGRGNPPQPLDTSLTFEDWRAQTADQPGWARCEAFRFVPEQAQAQCWDALGRQCQLQHESDWLAEKRRYEEWPPPKRHQSRQRSTAATSTKPGVVAFSTDDPLRNVAPRLYVEALTGETVPANGWLCCPLPDHDDTHPSFQVLDSHWRCFGCGRGGGVIDLAAALYGIEPRGSGYWEIRDRLVVDLQGVF